MKVKEPSIFILLAFLAFVGLTMCHNAQAQRVVHCYDIRTGTVITVAGFCPGGTYEVR